MAPAPSKFFASNIASNKMASAPVITRIETLRNPEYQEIVWTRIYSSFWTGLISNRLAPQSYDKAHSYAGTGKVEHTRQYNTPHGLGETINSLIQAGLTIDFVHEHQLAPNKILPIHEPAGKRVLENA
jgi:hypothetical protein